MYERLVNAISSKPRVKTEQVTFGPFYNGLVTEILPEQMDRKDLFESLNMIMIGSGWQRTRDGSTLVSSGCTGDIVKVDDIKIGGTWYTIISDTDNKLYYDNSGTATAIATLEGEAQFIGFMGLLIIFDGDFIKTWDGTTLRLAYDNGSGTTAYQLNQRTSTVDDTKDIQLGHTSGSGVTSISYEFTTQDWSGATAGTYTTTIPPTTLYADMYKVGSPTGNVEAQITTTAGVECAAVNFATAVSSFATTAGGSTSGVEYEAIFTSSDIATELSPDTSYNIKLNYSAGDAANYVIVKHIALNQPKVSLKPGMPPKAAYGEVENNRIFCIEGESGTNPSYLRYCNASDYLDWSTADGGGYAPVIDDSATNFPIGAIASYYGSIWVFGTKRQPFMGQLTGSSPSAYTVNKTLQNVSAHYKSTIVTPDDVVFLHPSGVDLLSTVQEYGDIKVNTQTDNIRKTIHEYFSTAAVAGYDPVWGLYCFKMSGDDHVYCVHTRQKTTRFNGKAQQVYSPVTRWDFAFSDTVTCFGLGDGHMYVGTDAGKVYKMDSTVVDDNSNTPVYKFITAATPTKFGEAQAIKIGFSIFGRYGGSGNFVFYKNRSRTSFFEKSFVIPFDSSVLTSEMTMLTSSADFYLDSGEYYDRQNINFNFRSLQIGIEDIDLSGKPLYFGPVDILVNKIGGL